VARFQVIEYLSSFLTHRVAWSRLNAVTVIAGGFGIWKRDTILGLGGYATDVTHEDIELTVHAHQQSLHTGTAHRMPMVPTSTIWTEVPSSWRDLCRQRKRWQRVVLEVLWKYRGMLFNPRYGTVGLLMMPYVLLYEALGPLIEGFAYAFVIALALFGLLNVKFLLLFLVFSFGLSAAARLAALVTDAVFFETYDVASVAQLGLLALLEPVLYRPALLGPRLYAFYEFFTGHTAHEPLTRVPVGASSLTS
jgi:cellulose synthase/poly-beta-1,6-N-acetylglucosamine synthase-like glycosyltransferase